MSSKQTVRYDGLPRWEADDRAIKDIEHYLTGEKWRLIREFADTATTVAHWKELNMSMGFMGVSGFPVHAFGRRYCLVAYRAWMGEEPKPIETDEQGYKI